MSKDMSIPKKPTWVEMLESSIEELKKEYDDRFKKLEEELSKNITIQQLDLGWALFLLVPNKTAENFDIYLDTLRDFLKESKNFAVFKERKELDTVLGLAMQYNIGSFDDFIKKLSTRFTMQLIKESLTIEAVTQHYGTEGARIFKTL